MNEWHFWEYKFQAETLCLGERVKKATIRPTILTIPSTQATGAVRAATRRDDLWAIGYLEEGYLKNPRIERMVYAPRDKNTDISKLPLEVEVLYDVCARIFVRAPGTQPPFRNLEILLGAFRSKGIGRGRLALTERAVSETCVTGELKSRLPEADATMLGIERVFKPVYGYLFKPALPGDEYSLGGSYVRALLERSLVRGYAFIIKRKEM